MPDNSLKTRIQQSGIIADRQLEEASIRAYQRDTSLIQQLEELGLITDHELAVWIAKESGLPLVEQWRDTPELAELLPADVCLGFSCVPVSETEREVVVATSNPFGPLQQVLRQVLQKSFRIVVAPDSLIRASLYRQYQTDLRHPETYQAILEDSMETQLDLDDRDRAIRLVHTMLADAIEIDGDIHIMPTSHGWRACMCLGDDTDELFSMSHRVYLEVANYLRSFLKGEEDSGEFLLKISDVEYVRFFLDVDRDYTGEQLFLAIIEHHIVEESQTLVPVTLEMPTELFEDFERACESTGSEIGQIIEHAWSLTRDVIDTPCVRPYVEKHHVDVVETTIQLTRTTVEEMEKAATQQQQNLQYVILKVLLMSRECVLRNLPDHSGN